MPVGTRRTIEAKAGQLRLVVVADTHSAPHPRAATLIALEKPDHILHAGDIGELSVIDRLGTIAPTIAVRGNIDEHLLPDSITLDLVDGDRTMLTLLLTHIAVNGPKLRADAARLAQKEQANLVICGHSHIPFIGRDKGLAVFNPGSIGPRRFQLPIVFGLLEIAGGKVSLAHIDCETGKRWQP